jgi:hypothetical protein
MAKNRTEPENAVSEFLHFQRLAPLKMAGLPAPHWGNADKSAFP